MNIFEVEPIRNGALPLRPPVYPMDQLWLLSGVPGARAGASAEEPSTDEIAPACGASHDGAASEALWGKERRIAELLFYRCAQVLQSLQVQPLNGGAGGQSSW